MWRLRSDCAESAPGRGYMLRESSHKSGLIGAKALINSLLTIFVAVGTAVCLIGPLQTYLRSIKKPLTSC